MKVRTWTAHRRRRLAGRRVKKGRSVRTILHTGSDRGAVYLDRYLDGFKWWNLDELTLAPKKRRGARG